MYDDWMSIGEIRKRSGMSERSVYRWIRDENPRQAHRNIPGRRALPVFHPEDAAKLFTKVLPPEAESRQDLPSQLPPPEFWVALVEALRQGPLQLPAAETTAETRQDPEAETAESLAKLRQQVIVTHKEAHRLGFSPAILSRAVKIGKIERLTGNRYRVRELEAM